MSGYMYDESTWDEKFEARKELLAPEPFVTMHIPKGKRLRILDLACGDGRNALHLAKKGHDILAIDFSEVALKKLSQYGEAMGLSVVTLREDVSKLDASVLGEFDVIIMSHYLPPKEVMKACYDQLKEEGLLIALGFNKDDQRNLGDHAFCGQDLVRFIDPKRIITNVTFADGRGDFDGIVIGK